MATLPFRNNPPIFARWSKEKKGSIRKCYYDISVVEGLLKIHFREEKQVKKGSRGESPWHSWFEFPVDSQFAKDLKLFLDEYLKPQTSTHPMIVEKSKKEENKQV